jgi:hypothetical protein
MNRYLIETPHDEDDCKKVVKQTHSAGYLHYFEWGCADGIHCGWAMVEAESVEHAYQMVPWSVRSKARVIKLNKFDTIDALHK